MKLAEDIFFHFSQTLAVALAIGLLAAVELQLVAAQLAALSETESPRLFLFAGGHSEWAELMPKD